MPKQRRRKPPVVTKTTLPDGTIQEVMQSWDEAFKDFGQYGQVLAEHSFLHSHVLMKESDRAVGVLAPAFLDSILEELLRVVLAKVTSTETLLRDQGPLGTFSSRIDMARSLNLIDDDAWRDLHLFRKIRNDFAHSVHMHGFAEPEIAARCRELRTPYRYGPEKPDHGPRMQFLFAMWTVAK